MLINLFKKIMKEKKTRVTVLMGGPSSEHEVSLATGKMVIKHLDRDKYDILPIVVTKEGKWPIKIKELKDGCDVVFIAMHGEYGEDGRLQSLLEKFRIPYTGSDSRASKLAMDKKKSATVLIKKGLSCPAFSTLTKKTIKAGWPIAHFRLPLVVKPNDRGSSVGTHVIKTLGQLAPAISNAFCFSNNVMVQDFIRGRELTCGVLEIKGKSTALPPTEIIPKQGKFFDYQSKYVAGASKEITPPKLPKEIIEKIQKTALKAHRSLKCSSYSRTDMILDDNGHLHILEVNTLPGLTRTSLIPQAAKKAGIDFSQLLDIIVNNARKN